MIGTFYLPSVRSILGVGAAFDFILSWIPHYLLIA